MFVENCKFNFKKKMIVTKLIKKISDLINFL